MRRSLEGDIIPHGGRLVIRTSTHAVARATVFTFARAAGSEHLHFAGDNFRGVAINAVLVCPFARLQTPLNIHPAAFVQVLATNFSQLAPGNDAVPLGLFLHLTILAFPAFSGGHVESSHLGSALGVADLGICA